MSRRTDRDTVGPLLRWYPRWWRDRYGDGMVAMIEDVLDGAPPTRRLRLSLVRAGLTERWRDSGLAADPAVRGSRTRAGALVVLCAWSLTVLAGSGFAKFTEHWRSAVPAGTGRQASIGFALVEAGAWAGGAIVVVAAAAAVPSFLRFLRAGGWPSVRDRFLQASAASVVALAATAAMVVWAHRLGPAQRNGGLWPFAAVGAVWVTVVAVTVVLWTAAVVATVRRLELPGRVLRAEGVCAWAVTAAIAVVTAGTALWWSSLASVAPWFPAGEPAGGRGGPVAPVLGLSAAALAVATVAGLAGSVRVARDLRHRRPAAP